MLVQTTESSERTGGVGTFTESKDASFSKNASGLTACVRFYGEVSPKINWKGELSDFSSVQYFNFSSMQAEYTPNWTVDTEMPFSREVGSYLIRNTDMFLPLSSVSHVIDNFLEDREIANTRSISVGTDVESPTWEALVIRYDLKNLKYSEVLRLWDEACKKAYEKLTPETAQKLILVFDGE